jgi:hypothetical protein
LALSAGVSATMRSNPSRTPLCIVMGCRGFEDGVFRAERTLPSVNPSALCPAKGMRGSPDAERRRDPDVWVR